MADRVLQTLIPDIECLAETKVAKYRLPGMALGIIRDQELAWVGGFGAADLDSGKKAYRKHNCPHRFSDENVHDDCYYAAAGSGQAQPRRPIGTAHS